VEVRDDVAVRVVDEPRSLDRRLLFLGAEGGVRARRLRPGDLDDAFVGALVDLVDCGPLAETEAVAIVVCRSTTVRVPPPLAAAAYTAAPAATTASAATTTATNNVARFRSMSSFLSVVYEQT